MESFFTTLEELSFSVWVRESGSVLAYPTILLLHVLCMAVVAGLSAMISLRLLGISPKLELAPLERLYPLMWWSFGVNAITGVALLISDPAPKLEHATFYVKMLFVFAGVLVLQRTRSQVFGGLGADGVPPAGARAMAWAALVCWTGAVMAGRLLAYVE